MVYCSQPPKAYAILGFFKGTGVVAYASVAARFCTFKAWFAFASGAFSPYIRAYTTGYAGPKMRACVAASPRPCSNVLPVWLFAAHSPTAVMLAGFVTCNSIRSAKSCRNLKRTTDHQRVRSAVLDGHPRHAPCSGGCQVALHMRALLLLPRYREGGLIAHKERLQLLAV